MTRLWKPTAGFTLSYTTAHGDWRQCSTEFPTRDMAETMGETLRAAGRAIRYDVERSEPL